MIAEVNLFTHKIINVLNPTDNQDVATKIYVDDIEHNATKIKDKEVDNSLIANDKILKYKTASGKLEYAIDESGGGGVSFPIGCILMYSGTWVDNSTIPGWYKCDGNNGTINLVDKFVRGGIVSGATGGSDDAVIVWHQHSYVFRHGVGLLTAALGGTVRIETTSANTGYTGESGVGKNIPVHHTLIFIQRIS